MADKPKGYTYQPARTFPDGSGLNQEFEQLRTLLDFRRISSDLLPSRSGTYSVGSIEQRWKALHAEEIRIGVGSTTYFHIARNPALGLAATMTLGIPLALNACLGFGSSGSFRLPRRTGAVTVGGCTGAGQVFSDTDDDSLNADFGAGTAIFGRRPTGQSDATAGIGGPWRVDDAGGRPVLSPVTTALSTPYGDLSDAALVVGVTSTPASAAGGATIYVTPGDASNRATVQIRPPTADRNVNFDLISAAGNTAFNVLNSSAGQTCGVQCSGTAWGATDVRAGPFAGPYVRAYLNGAAPTIETSAGNLTLSPFALTVTVNDNLSVTTEVAAGVRGQFGASNQRVICRSVAPAGSITTSTFGAGVDLRIEPTGDLLLIPAGGDIIVTGNLTGVTTLSALTLSVTNIITPATNTNLTITPNGTGQVNVVSALNSQTGINTGAGSGTQRISSAGALLNITSITLTGAIATATTITASDDIITTAGGISATSGAVANPAAGVIHGTNTRGGSATVYIDLYTTAGAGVVQTTGSALMILASNGGAGAGTCLILDSTSVSGTLASTNVATFNSATLANVGCLVSNGGVNVALPVVGGGAYQVGGTIIVTNTRVLNNLDADCGATGMILRLKEIAAASAPNANAGSFQTRELARFNNTALGTRYLSFKDTDGTVYSVLITAI